MTQNDLSIYIKNRIDEGMIKLNVEMESMPDEGDPSLMYINKSKETYVFETEDEADALIDEKRTIAGFSGVNKKFKAGKVNKNGEQVKPDQWIVVITLLH